MPYFENIQWVGYNHFPECRAWVDKYFTDYYVLNYAHTGKIILEVENGFHGTLEGPVAWWTFPGPYFKFGCRNLPPWDHRFVSFRGKRVNSLIEGGLLDISTRHPYCFITNPVRMKNALNDLHQYLLNPLWGQSRAITMLEGLLLQLQEQETILPETEGSSGMQNLLRRISFDPQQDWDFYAESERLSLSYPHFRRLFARAAGTSPQRFVIRRRMTKAAELLKREKRPLQETAEQVGYDDVYHFAKLFKKHMGESPGRFAQESHLK